MAMVEGSMDALQELRKWMAFAMEGRDLQARCLSSTRGDNETFKDYLREVARDGNDAEWGIVVDVYSLYVGNDRATQVYAHCIAEVEKWIDKMFGVKGEQGE